MFNISLYYRSRRLSYFVQKYSKNCQPTNQAISNKKLNEKMSIKNPQRCWLIQKQSGNASHRDALPEKIVLSFIFIVAQALPGSGCRGSIDISCDSIA